MSEPISAFAAYQANGVVKSPKNKTKNNASGKPTPKANKNKNKKNKNNQSGSPKPQGKKQKLKKANKSSLNPGQNLKTPSKSPSHSKLANTPKSAKHAKEPSPTGTPKTALNVRAVKSDPKPTLKLTNGTTPKAKKTIVTELKQQEDFYTADNFEILLASPSSLTPEQRALKTQLEQKISSKSESVSEDSFSESDDDNPNTEVEAPVGKSQTMKRGSGGGSLTLPKAKKIKTDSAACAQANASFIHSFVENVQPNTVMHQLSPTKDVVHSDSTQEGEKVFQWLISPLKIDDFFKKHWESGAVLIKRPNRKYFSHLISFESISDMLLNNHVEFTKNIDITSYKNGKRETLNPDGRALPPVVWDFYQKGCSVRLLNPQTFIPQIHSLCAKLQEYFCCLAGVNAYLTPAGTQGFAPHYDDIEAFVVQVEGQKRWKLYQPRKPAEYLARYSSENFKQSEIGEPIFEKVLHPGDVLYFPRGTIHQATSEPNSHSLHLTFSFYQKQSYADLFERLFPVMMEKAIDTSLDIRKGLPLNLWRNTGTAFRNKTTEQRTHIQQKIAESLQKIFSAVPLCDIIDDAVDQLAKKYQHEALPPVIEPNERSHTIFGVQNTKDQKGGWICNYDITLTTNVRLLRANILRLVNEEGKMRIYYYLDNSKEYCEYEPNYLEIARKESSCVELLINSYPKYVSVSKMPVKSSERKIGVVAALWERGLLMVERPFEKQ